MKLDDKAWRADDVWGLSEVPRGSRRDNREGVGRDGRLLLQGKWERGAREKRVEGAGVTKGGKERKVWEVLRQRQAEHVVGVVATAA